ncbi:STAS domain-containing protein [Streptomyces sp. NEAU-sy36]|uniref:STAS domain-containing protein n=1 Tax=unclassified Streptomyces TaxID=2593676 RepID=UPI0015D63ABB|nr:MULTISPECIES: STAS domain-containing protein [unclassified Streptomyces]QLJ02778.1 STAS domain-containing protein [Streptomyces sp. NEAU-sy36]
MNITTTIDGTVARISLCGEIDFATLPPLRAAVDALPPKVTDLQWDLAHTPFMDVAGLHLLFTPTSGGPQRRATVTGLRAQPLSLLLAAADVNPAVFDFCRLLPDVAPSGLRPAAP